MNAAKKTKRLDDAFISKIMLSVTEVNGCEICSYHHTEEALKNGMTEEEIETILSGNQDAILQEERIGILFAQHYADKKGKPSKETWERLVSEYGEAKALGILGATRMIMVGNTYGIGAGALKDRIKGKAVAKSNLAYELIITFSIFAFLPVAIIHAMIANGKKRELIQF
jgi:AhpD family alkylhydroperoxidase